VATISPNTNPMVGPFLKVCTRNFSEGNLSLDKAAKIYDQHITRIDQKYRRPNNLESGRQFHKLDEQEGSEKVIAEGCEDTWNHFNTEEGRPAFLAGVRDDKRLLIEVRTACQLQIAAKQQYYQTKTGKIAHLFSKFLSLLNIQTPLQKTQAILDRCESYLSGVFSNASIAHLDKDLSRELASKEFEHETNLNSMIGILKSSALTQKRGLYVQPGESPANPHQLVIAQKNGDVFVIDLRPQTLIGKGACQSVHKAICYSIGKEPKEVTFISTFPGVTLDNLQSYLATEINDAGLTHRDAIAQANRNIKQERAQVKKLECMTVNIEGTDFVFSALPPSLETEYRHAAFSIDLNAISNFGDYTSPNEGGVLAILRHLKMLVPGIIVSTGTERSFFDLALADPEMCQGLVVRDINPKIKAYVDFNVLLLRISKDRQEYVRLSSITKMEEIESRIEEIRGLMESADLSQESKAYYRTHLKEFGRIYLEQRIPGTDWRRKDAFNGVKYHEDDRLFNRLQRYAKEGKIIATVGSIGDLEFLNQRRIGIVDVSNIPDYAVLDFRTKSTPKIIITKQDPIQTTYRSYDFKPMTDRETRELHQLLDIFGSVQSNNEYLGDEISNRISFSSHSPIYFNAELLYALRKYKEQFLVLDPKYGWFEFSPTHNNLHEKIAELTPVQIQEMCRENKQFERYVRIIVEKWVGMDRDKYMAFSELPGWKEAFNEHALKHQSNPYFQTYFAGHANASST
jgi:hypothetical protein